MNLGSGVLIATPAIGEGEMRHYLLLAANAAALAILTYNRMKLKDGVSGIVAGVSFATLESCDKMLST